MSIHAETCPEAKAENKRKGEEKKTRVRKGSGG